jgi:hypothetical protein
MSLDVECEIVYWMLRLRICPPSCMPLTVNSKLSLSRMMLTASLDMSEPEMFIAIPRSTFFSAVESFIPLPITPKMCPRACACLHTHGRFRRLWVVVHDRHDFDPSEVEAPNCLAHAVLRRVLERDEIEEGVSARGVDVLVEYVVSGVGHAWEDGLRTGNDAVSEAMYCVSACQFRCMRSKIETKPTLLASSYVF